MRSSWHVFNIYGIIINKYVRIPSHFVHRLWLTISLPLKNESQRQSCAPPHPQDVSGPCSRTAVFGRCAARRSSEPELFITLFRPFVWPGLQRPLDQVSASHGGHSSECDQSCSQLPVAVAEWQLSLGAGTHQCAPEFRSGFAYSLIPRSCLKEFYVSKE